MEPRNLLLFNTRGDPDGQLGFEHLNEGPERDPCLGSVSWAEGLCGFLDEDRQWRTSRVSRMGHPLPGSGNVHLKGQGRSAVGLFLASTGNHIIGNLPEREFPPQNSSKELMCPLTC